jgi:hypothetical protein
VISVEGKNFFGTEYLAVSAQGSQDLGCVTQDTDLPWSYPCLWFHASPALYYHQFEAKTGEKNTCKIPSLKFLWNGRKEEKPPEVPHDISCNVIKVSFWEPPRWPRLLRYKLCRA